MISQIKNQFELCNKFGLNIDAFIQKVIQVFSGHVQENEAVFNYPLNEVPPLVNFSTTIKRMRNIKQIIKKEFQSSLTQEQWRVEEAKRLINANTVQLNNNN